MLNRRKLLGAGTAAVATWGFLTTSKPGQHRQSTKVAHVTDIHITSDRSAASGVAAMFAHQFGRPDWSPEIVLNTGDTVMALDGSVSGKRAQQQIELWQAATKNCHVPIYSCLGNHDVWDLHEPTAEIPAEKAGFKLMKDVLDMPRDYYSFDHGGWHFIALNSVCQWPKYGVLSEEHLTWLVDDLNRTPRTTPICVLSHLPILSITSSVYGDDCRKGDDVVIPGTWQHADGWVISEIFRRHPNVKLCLSGHMHTCDRCEYRGVWYICGGAVSGAWWNGSQYGFPPCYGQLDLFDDGTFSYQFVDYGWEKRDWRGKEWLAS